MRRLATSVAKKIKKVENKRRAIARSPAFCRRLSLKSTRFRQFKPRVGRAFFRRAAWRRASRKKVERLRFARAFSPSVSRSRRDILHNRRQAPSLSPASLKLPCFAVIAANRPACRRPALELAHFTAILVKVARLPVSRR